MRKRTLVVIAALVGASALGYGDPQTTAHSAPAASTAAPAMASTGAPAIDNADAIDAAAVGILATYGREGLDSFCSGDASAALDSAAANAIATTRDALNPAGLGSICDTSSF